MDMWQKALPEGIKAEIGHLAGLALVVDSTGGLGGSQTVVKRFPESALPNSIQVLQVLVAQLLFVVTDTNTLANMLAAEIFARFHCLYNITIQIHYILYKISLIRYLSLNEKNN